VTILSGEWLIEWVKEILYVSWISRIKLPIELASVEAIDKQSQSTFKGMRAAREASRRSCQARQIVTQLGVASFDREGVGFALRDFIFTEVVPQATISIKRITIIQLSFRRFVYHLLNGWLCTFPNHLPTQIAARLPVYVRDDVDPVFLLPINVNSSSISAVLTSLGTGVSGKLAALACTHNETVR
jgi:hypothetical protein